MKAYRQSKLANVYFTRELAKRLKTDDVKNVKVCSLHPGAVRTELSRYLVEENPFFWNTVIALISPIYLLMLKSPWWGTQTSLHCCLIPWDQLQSGLYYADCKVKQETLCENWEAEAKKLWEISEQTVKAYTEDDFESVS